MNGGDGIKWNIRVVGKKNNTRKEQEGKYRQRKWRMEQELDARGEKNMKARGRGKK